LAALRVMDPNRSEIGDLANTLSSRLLESGKQALAAKAFDRSQQLASAAKDVGVRSNEAAIDQLLRDLTDARTSTGGGAGSVVSAATLRRTKTVEPVYPAGARRRNEEGWVEVAFTVTPVGGVEKVEVRNSNPSTVFDEAAMKAVEQWRFEPIKVNGQAISQRAIVRLRFSLD
jgi:protein TonB